LDIGQYFRMDRVDRRITVHRLTAARQSISARQGVQSASMHHRAGVTAHRPW
jgi:hypothetical protein